MPTKPDPRPPAQQKHDRDNHSNQLNPNNSEFQRSRTPAPQTPPNPPAKK